MTNMLASLMTTAARGAEGLTSESREVLGGALRSLQRADGGFAGLDGRSDPYYSLFAWLSLKALGATCDRDRLCNFMAARRHADRTVDAQCADILLASEGRSARVPWMRTAAAAVSGDTREIYGAFLRMLATGDVPRWVERLAWRKQRRTFAAGAAGRLPTPRLAAGLVLAARAGDRYADIRAALGARRCAGGGVASAPGALPDLLATAAARFSLACVATDSRPSCDETMLGRADVFAGRTREDLAFIEACWLEDGLFGASPTALHGDAEHTFYGLLALGTCR